MDTTTRWFFKTRKGTVVVDGNPALHPNWVEYHRRYRPDGGVLKEYAVIEFDGVEVRGTKLRATQTDNIQCNTRCETAKNPKCSCQCGGKNHGIAYKEEENA